jgi:hypothetical protein
MPTSLHRFAHGIAHFVYFARRQLGDEFQFVGLGGKEGCCASSMLMVERSNLAFF